MALLAVLLVATPGRADDVPVEAEVIATQVAGAYDAWQRGDLVAARAQAEAAIAADGSIRTLLARRVLVLVLDAEGDVAGALRALDGVLSFELTPRDRAWADDLRPILRSKLPPNPAPETGRPAPAEAPPVGRSRVTLGVGGAFLQLGPWSYGGARLDGLVRIAGPLHVGLGAAALVSELTGCGGAEGTSPIDACRTLLMAPSVGLALRAPVAAAAPLVDVRLLLAPERGVPERAPLRAGLHVGGGLEIPLPPGSPLILRPHVSFDLLFGGTGPLPGVMAGLDVAVRLGGAAP